MHLTQLIRGLFYPFATLRNYAGKIHRLEFYAWLCKAWTVAMYDLGHIGPLKTNGIKVKGLIKLPEFVLTKLTLG